MTRTARSGRGAAAGRLLLSSVPVVSLTYLYTLAWLVVWLVLGVFVLGFTPVAVTSGSMEPAIRTGDVVLEEPAPDGVLGPPNVVTFPHPSQPDRSVTHRITGVNPDGTLQTRGDANPTPDSDAVHPDDVEGVARLLLPWAALPALWARSGQAVPLGLWLAGTLVAFVLATRALRSGGGPTPALVPGGAAPLWTAHSPPARPQRVTTAAGFAARRGAIGRGEPVPADATSFAARRGPAGRRGTGRRAQATRRGRAAAAARAGRMGMAGTTALAAVLCLNLVLPPTGAAFAGTTANGTSEFAATTVTPPTDVTAEFDCGVLGVGKKNIVTWTASPSTGKDGYDIYRKVGTGSYSFLASVGAGATSYNDSLNLSNSTTYTYKLRTTAGTWESVDSNEASVTTPGFLSCPL